MSAEPTVFVVDDNLGVRNSLHALMKSAGLAVETFESSEAFLDAYDPERPGCLVLDVRLRAGASGLDLQDELRRRSAMLPIIVLTGHGNVPTSVRALKAGAVDFLQKPVPPRILVEKIRAAIATDRRAREAAMKHGDVRARVERLTPREQQVMKLLVKGATSKEIAYDLKLSVRTVEAHRRAVLRKMDVTSAAQLVRTVIGTPGETG
jgi:two-component system, LuxR family, response regulator FixJ